jgi:hypothetical protein
VASSFPKALDTIFGAAEVFAEQFNKMSGGKFTVSVHAGGELMPAFGVVDGVQQGTVEMAHTAPYYFFGKDETFALDTAIPFGLNSGLLTAWIGALPTAVPTETDRLAILLIEGIAMPLAQGVLFWIFIQRAAGPVRLRGAWLAAWLFAGAAVLISNAGVSAGAAALPQGIGAAMITAISGTGWAGVIAAVTYGLASLLLPPYLLNWLGINALSLNWAAAALFSLFGIFFLLQTAQARLPQAEKPVDSEAEQLRRQPFLWLFVVLVVIFVGLEIFLRSRPA